MVPSLAAGSDERMLSFQVVVSKFSFPGGEQGQPGVSLLKIAISLNCAQNSVSKFQTGVSNSGAQIPKHARQNSEVPQISCFSLQNPQRRPQISWRRFLNSRFSVQVPGPDWKMGDPPFLISRFSLQTQGRQGAGHYTFLIFGFKFPNSSFKRGPCTSQIHWLLGSRFAFPVSRWASIPGI